MFYLYILVLLYDERSLPASCDISLLLFAYTYPEMETTL